MSQDYFTDRAPEGVLLLPAPPPTPPPLIPETELCDIDLAALFPEEAGKVNSTSVFLEVIAEDTGIINHSIKAMKEGWRAATTVDEICKLALTTAKLLEARRKLMLFDYEKTQGRGAGGRNSGYLGAFDDSYDAQ